METTTLKENTKGPTTTPASREPFAMLREMQRAMMRPFFESFPFPSFDLEPGPAVNLKEQDGTYVMECTLPGYKKDDISVEVSGDAVTIAGSYKDQKSEEKAHYHRREYRQGSFARTIELPAEIDADKAAASFENGMLKLTLPPSKTSTKKKVAISG